MPSDDTQENLPSPEFLLDDADMEVLKAYVSGGAPTADLREQAHKVWMHLSSLMDLEMLAAARAKGVPRAFQGMYFTAPDTWPLLARPRRVIYAIQHFAGMAAASGLGQACANYEELLPFWIEAAGVLSPPTLADELRPYLEQMRGLLAAMHENAEPSPEVLALWRGDEGSLEKRVWDTDWMVMGIRHAMDNRAWFFLRPHQGSKRHPVTDYFALEAEWRETEKERARRKQLALEAEADAHITPLRCPACGSPMPGYRESCKHCGAKRGRV